MNRGLSPVSVGRGVRGEPEWPSCTDEPCAHLSGEEKRVWVTGGLPALSNGHRTGGWA